MENYWSAPDGDKFCTSCPSYKNPCAGDDPQECKDISRFYEAIEDNRVEAMLSNPNFLEVE
jgi:hypothetical protein